ncbi:proteasome maturation protein isoform X1 [Falco rusticolus]|uniref:proteasome maturation protein isoform X1 n=1 Tax=Falco rusticolus TaxID=120794 RepID=UPI00188692ED|nr:proteasome maturation protein isoform X1 [Falco rusticolus]
MLSHGVWCGHGGRPPARPGGPVSLVRPSAGWSLPGVRERSRPRRPEGCVVNSRGAASLLKDVIPITEFSASGLLEGPDLLRRGFTSVKNELLPTHPLELSEKNFQLNQDKTNFATLRNIQGLHAPLKLQMELRAVKQVQRLPFLYSSNIALDTLRGNDESIGFEDILNDPSQSEVMGEPHMMMEYKLGLF